jgi:pimeloyl-ACP methyl ester carboxylesterase
MSRSPLLLLIVFSILVIILGTSTITSNIILGNNTVTAVYAQENNNIVNDKNNNPTASTGAGQRVSFLTDDKVLIVGTYYPAQTTTTSSTPSSTTTSNAVILLHMLGHNRSDWNGFVSTLGNKTNGYAVLSIDLRGHGESTSSQNGNTISFQSFTPDDFNKMVMDVKAAKQFLVTQKNINPNDIAIVGASIGANVALNYAASDPSIKAVVLLSPGLDYRGVTTSDAIRQYKGPIYIATAGKDPIAGNDPQTLCNEIKCSNSNRLQIYQDSNSHGTDMFSDSSLQPSLDKLIISWLNTAFGKSL